MNIIKKIKYVITTPTNVVCQKILKDIANKINQHPSHLLLIACIFFGSGVFATYKVIIPLNNYFFEHHLSHLTYAPPIEGNQTIAVYQHWCDEHFNEEKVNNFMLGEIARRANNDQRLINIYQKMQKNQNITIQRNDITKNVYIFSNKENHKSQLLIYHEEPDSLSLKKEIIILHPNFKVGNAKFDEKNKKIYLGVIGKRWDEGDFGGLWIEGDTVIDLNY